MTLTKKNYILLLIGFGIIVLGLVLMAGTENIFSFRKITLAPILVVGGFVFEIFALLKRFEK